MVNRLVHDVAVDSRETVETVAQLLEAIKNCSSGCDDNLDKTYVVELLSERLSDKSIVYSLSIREAEAV